MWFWFSIIALVCWSGSDLFSKIGCADKSDKYSHFKMVTAVGAVMGIHAIYQILFKDVELTADVILQYLPVSALYILSMAIGYIGLRYIELSVSSPICNSSGALVAILCIITGDALAVPQYIAIALVCFGVIGLGFVEAREDDELRALRQQKGNYKYAKSPLAIVLPLIYCILDALGSFADSMVLEKFQLDYIHTNVKPEFKNLFAEGIPESFDMIKDVDSVAYLDEFIAVSEEVSATAANTAYELMFLICGIACFIYVKFIKKQKYFPKKEAPKYTGAIFETAGQFAYVFALSDAEHVAMSAPIISAYCVASVLWGRIFLKEKLSFKHYITITIAVIGIVIMGIYDA